MDIRLLHTGGALHPQHHDRRLLRPPRGPAHATLGQRCSPRHLRVVGCHGHACGVLAHDREPGRHRAGDHEPRAPHPADHAGHHGLEADWGLLYALRVRHRHRAEKHSHVRARGRVNGLAGVVEAPCIRLRDRLQGPAHRGHELDLQGQQCARGPHDHPAQRVASARLAGAGAAPGPAHTAAAPAVLGGAQDALPSGREQQSREGRHGGGRRRGRQRLRLRQPPAGHRALLGCSARGDGAVIVAYGISDLSCAGLEAPLRGGLMPPACKLHHAHRPG
mmetsp:Transcript_47393/g.131790  ORF Transcript_47393/g.131790 Transcript_47393/m.131790 type:complete len:277 (+) Transcript_47393:1924-2754(+)